MQLLLSENNTSATKFAATMAPAADALAAAAAATGPTHQEVSLVERMFDGRSVFITGASGFIGRVLLEKLLRSYRGIKRIYILMRAKKNQQPYERLHKQLLKVPIFDAIRSMKNGDELLEKIVVVAGDIAEPQLGISETDLKMMLDDESLSVVFHSAATIKFDEPLKVSVTLNLMATRAIIDLCHRLPNLMALCHVSTAYVNAHMKDQPIEERVYPISDEPDKLIQLAGLLDENLMQELKVKLVGQRPNTYTYTKALAEHLIVKEGADLPVAIVRPSIVVAAWKEPLCGWVDNLNGPTGLILAIGKGLLRSMVVRRSVVADVIPVDIVVNTMIASTFYAAKINNKLPMCSGQAALSGASSASVLPAKCGSGSGRTPNGHSLESVKEEAVAVVTPEEEDEAPTAAVRKIGNNNNNNDNKCPADKQQNNHKPVANGNSVATATTRTQEQHKADDTRASAVAAANGPPIIHCNSGDVNPITWGEMEDMFFPIIRKYPSCQVLRYPFGTFKANKYHDLLARIFAHYLPALILDMLSVMLGRKRQLLSIYYKLHSAVGALRHFCTTNYHFKTKNIKLIEASLSDVDRRDLYMDIKDLHWTSFWDSYVLGARRFVLKEEDHTLPEARRSFLRAYYIEIGLRVLLTVTLGLGGILLLMRLSPTTRLMHSTLQAFNICV